MVLHAFNNLDLGIGEVVQLIDPGIDGAMDVLWAGTRPAPTYVLLYYPVASFGVPPLTPNWIFLFSIDYIYPCIFQNNSYDTLDVVHHIAIREAHYGIALSHKEGSAL